MFRIRLICVHCSKKELTSKGLYNILRTVLDIDAVYYLATEYLVCKSCGKTYISWSMPVLEQLDLGHRSQFPVVLTHWTAIDGKVLTLLRSRTLDNTPTALHHSREELHGEAWLRQLLLYLTDSTSIRHLLLVCIFSLLCMRPHHLSRT